MAAVTAATSGNRGRADPEAVRRAYDTVAADYARLLPDTRAEQPAELALLEAFADAAGPGAVILDAGCGAGRMSRYLADRGHQVEGVDLSPAMVEQARRHHPDLAFRVGSLDRLPYPDGRFTGVLLWYSVIHTPPADLPTLMAEAVRVLAPGGQLLVGFQAGTGTRDVSASYRRLGHEVVLERHLHEVADVAAGLAAAGAREVARLVRPGVGHEGEDQAFLHATRARP